MQLLFLKLPPLVPLFVMRPALLPLHAYQHANAHINNTYLTTNNVIICVKYILRN
jgi:hypothetical protein